MLKDKPGDGNKKNIQSPTWKNQKNVVGRGQECSLGKESGFICQLSY